MNNILIVSICLLALVFICYVIINAIRFKRISDEIERINWEQSKINFLLLVSEKKKKGYQDKKIG